MAANLRQMLTPFFGRSVKVDFCWWLLLRKNREQSNFSPWVCFWWVFWGSNFTPLDDSGSNLCSLYGIGTSWKMEALVMVGQASCLVCRRVFHLCFFSGCTLPETNITVKISCWKMNFPFGMVVFCWCVHFVVIMFVQCQVTHVIKSTTSSRIRSCHKQFESLKTPSRTKD